LPKKWQKWSKEREKKEKNENNFWKVKVGEKSITLFNAHSWREILGVLQNEHTFSLLLHFLKQKKEKEK
jgi:hypothetical protein